MYIKNMYGLFTKLYESIWKNIPQKETLAVPIYFLSPSTSLIEEDVAHLSEDFHEVQVVVEDAENLAKKNNIRLRGLVEGEDLSDFLQNLFMACLGSKSYLEIKLLSAYRVDFLNKYQQKKTLVILQ